MVQLKTNMLIKISRIFVLIASLLTILYVLVFTLSYRFGWLTAVRKWINLEFYGKDVIYTPVQLLIEWIINACLIIILPVSIYLVNKRSWQGIIGLFAVGLYIYHIYLVSNIN